MFKKRITPFACIITALLAVAVTFVAVSASLSVKHNAELNDYRLKTSAYNDYSELISLVGGNADKYEKLAQIIALIEGDYIHDYDSQLLWENVYRSLIISIGDAYSQYLTAEEYYAVMNDGSGEFVGIGVHATYDADTNGIYIFGVIPDSPAQSAGLLKGDVIIAAEGVAASAENYYEMLELIRGESGTDVDITVQRGEEKLDFTITRADVASENVLYEKLDNGIAYLRILSFADETVSEEFASKIGMAQTDGCKKFIFDVRNNAGGYLEEIISVLDILLPEGPIINIVDSSGTVTTRNSEAGCITAEGMAVLCNASTASAAELFTAALRDYDLAEVIGNTTFGKGTMQTSRVLPDGSMIKLSTAFYNPPKNVSYDGIGITPDYDVELSGEWTDRFFKMPKEEDLQLQKAIELLTSTQ